MRVGQRLRKDLQWDAKAVRSARSVVQAVGDRIEFALVVDREVGALGQILPQQPVGVLASISSPRAVRIAEVHANVGPGSEFSIPSHLLALVVSQALAHGRKRWH